MATRGGNSNEGCFAVKTSSSCSLDDVALLDRPRPRVECVEGGGRSDGLSAEESVSKPGILKGSITVSAFSNNIRNVEGTLDGGGRIVGLGEEVSSVVELKRKSSDPDVSMEEEARTVSNSQAAPSRSSSTDCSLNVKLVIASKRVKSLTLVLPLLPMEGDQPYSLVYRHFVSKPHNGGSIPSISSRRS